jgi:hypothetical protein
LIAPWEVESTVPEYRVFTVGLDGHFLKSDGFECADDDAAVKHAQQFLESRDVELWCGGRFIVKLTPPRK